MRLLVLLKRNFYDARSRERKIKIYTVYGETRLILFNQSSTLFGWIIIIPQIETSDNDQAWPKHVEYLLNTTRLMSL